MNYKAFRFIAMIASVIFLYQCGGQKEQVTINELDVLILDIDDTIPIETIQTTVQSFQEKHQNTNVNVTTTNIASDSSYNTIQETIKNIDVVLFPSIIEDTLSPRSSSFYPLKPSESLVQNSIIEHYMTSNDSGLWAQPLLIDPVIKIIRKDAVQKTGNQFFPRLWNETYLIGDLAASDESYRYPQLKIYDYKQYGLSDTVAAYYLSRGLFHDVVIGKGFSKELTIEQIKFTEFDILKTISVYLNGKNNTDNHAIEYVNSLEEMIEKKGLFTFMRHSMLKNTKDHIQDQFYYGIAPNIHDEKPVLCYSVNASVPIGSVKPELAKEFIQFMEKDIKTNTNNEGYFNLSELSDNPFFPDNFFMVLRTNSNSIHEKFINEILTQKKDIIELNKIWLSGFKILNSKK